MTTDSEQGLAKMKKETRDFMPHGKQRSNFFLAWLVNLTGDNTGHRLVPKVWA